MTETIQILLVLLAVLAAAALIARRLNTAPSIVLVIAGVALALIPGLPRIELAPELVLLVILPPLIYSAGVAMSWREFRFNLRPIALLAFGCVVFTTCAVAVAAHYVLGLPWAVGFLLGAIVAPPDVVAPLAIARRLGLPRRLLVVLEGEGPRQRRDRADPLPLRGRRDRDRRVLVRRRPPAPSRPIVVGEIAWGIGVGWLSLHAASRCARDPRVEIVLSLMTPYLAYWVPEHLGGSGVLATVAAGLYVSWNGPLLISSATRLQGIFFWDLIIYLIEGFVFLLTGLQARTLIEKAQTFSLRELVGRDRGHHRDRDRGALRLGVSGDLPAALDLARRCAGATPPRPGSWTFVLAFTGVRGVVSLAAALAIPLTLANGQPFPHRDLILFITFGVIVLTLVGLGLMLPAVIRWLGVARHRKAEEREEKARELAGRHEAMEEALRQVEARARERGLPDELVAIARARHEARSRQFPRTVEEGWDAIAPAAHLRMELIAAEREYIYQLLRDGKISDEARRRIERELDLEEALIACKVDEEKPQPGSG